jgi:hypothetical protein
VTGARSRLPSWVGEANRRLASRTPAEPAGTGLAAPRIGELRIAQPVEAGTAEPRLVCVLDTDPRLATVRAALVLNEVDVAAGADLLAPAADTGLPVDLAVARDVTGTLWWSQVARCVGRLDRRRTDLVRDAVSNGPGSVPRRVRGVPVVAADDARRELKAGERAAMRALAADCEAAGVDRARPLPLLVDPALVEILATDDAASYASRLTAIVAELAIADRPVLPGGAAAVILEAWDRGFRGSRDTWQGLLPLLERALSTPAGTPGGESCEYEPERRSVTSRADGALAQACAEQARLGAKAIRLLTTPAGWTRGSVGAPALATVRVGGGDPLRLIHQHLEVNP